MLFLLLLLLLLLLLFEIDTVPSLAVFNDHCNCNSQTVPVVAVDAAAATDGVVGSLF